MKKVLAILCVAALPALAQGNKTKTVTNTNPAGSHTMTMTKSGTGQNRIISKTMTNTEGNKSLTRTSVNRPRTHRAKSFTKIAMKSHKRISPARR